MTAAVHVICGPAGAGKSQRLLARCLDRASEPVGPCLWIGPGRRAVDAVRERLAGASRSLFPPRLFTFQELADEIVRHNDPEARPLSHAQRRLLVEDLVVELHVRGELSHFQRVVETRGFAEGVTALIAELKRNEVRPAAFARAAYRRGYEGEHVGGRKNWQVISRKERQVARLYARYQQLLARNRLYDLEGRQWHARDLLARGLLKPFDGVRAVFVAGFADFTRTQHETLAALARHVEELWITLPDEPGEERAEVFTRPRATLERLRGLNPQIIHLTHPEWDQQAQPPASGLVHVERQLFRPLRAVEVSPDATGVTLIEAPGMLGECRLVARQVKRLLLDGTPAEEVLITARDLAGYADLIQEVFAEYGIPLDVEGTAPLLRNPAVACLVRSLRLPEEDWPFAVVTALLRSNYFAPAWPENADHADLAQHSEVLLRLVGEPRGREAYLEAVRRWEESPPQPLEDEHAEASRRQRTHELAKRCRRFLMRFFAVWDEAPQKATPLQHVAWVRRFADDLGLFRQARQDEADASALARLWEDLDRWAGLSAEVHGPGRPLDRKTFLHRLTALAAAAGLARTPRGPGRVRVLSAELARHRAVAHLFILGLGERSFPRLAAAEPVFDDTERQSFRQAGLDFPTAGERMPDEMLLFYQLVTRARRRLVLSYPAVDDKGQELLPSSFLSALRNCFELGAIQVERRNMLIERYDQDRPLCPAEHRVRVAASWADGRAGERLPADLRHNLRCAAEQVRQRTEANDFTPYDGFFRDPALTAELAQLFQPERILSPTALESYVTCPFQFFLRHVLRLEPLEEPREEIESTRRGQACHRALARLHEQLRSAGTHQPTPEVDGHLLKQLEAAVEEYVGRAPSPASKELWRLEGKRLARVAARYRQHWSQFVAPWLENQVEPRPVHFELDFGVAPAPGREPLDPLVLRLDGDEVRVGGRIDRIDVAELADGCGFWIIDYKTGRPGSYTAKDLKEFRKLQLTLYALAVERVLLAPQNARPLGLAYWLVADEGPKPVLPGSGKQVTKWLADADGWATVRDELERWVVTLIRHVRAGHFPLKPRDEQCTAACDYAQVCRINQVRSVVENKAWQLPLPLVP